MSEKQETRSNSRTALTRRQFIHGASAAAVTIAGVSTGRVRGANERLGVGFIGCGGRSNAHFKTVHYLKTNGANVDIVAVCDTYRPRLENKIKGYKAKGYDDHRELLDAPNVDVVCISTPDHLHGYQAIDGLVQKGLI